MALQRCPTGAAMFHRPIRRQPAAFTEDCLPAHIIVFAESLAMLDLGFDIARKLGRDEVADFFLKRRVGGAEREFPS